MLRIRRGRALPRANQVGRVTCTSLSASVPWSRCWRRRAAVSRWSVVGTTSFCCCFRLYIYFCRLNAHRPSLPDPFVSSRHDLSSRLSCLPSCSGSQFPGTQRRRQQHNNNNGTVNGTVNNNTTDNNNPPLPPQQQQRQRTTIPTPTTTTAAAAAARRTAGGEPTSSAPRPCSAPSCRTSRSGSSGRPRMTPPAPRAWLSSGRTEAGAWRLAGPSFGWPC